MVGGVSQTPTPFQIGAAHGAFAIDIRTEKRGTVWLQLSHNVFGTEFDGAPPTLRHYVAFRRIQSDHDPSWVEFFCQPLKKWQVQFSFMEHGAADDDLFRFPPRDPNRT